MGFVNKILATAVFTILAFLALSPLAAALAKGGKAGPIVFLVTLVVVGLLVFWAPSGRRAWGRGSLIAGACFLALPLSMIGLSGRAAQDVVSNAPATDAGATAIGATLGAGLMVGASAILGFIVGGILIILGLVLVLGGRREVVIIERK